MTLDTADAGRKYFEENVRASRGYASSDCGIPKTPMRMILTQDLDTRPLRQAKKQRAKSPNAEKRLNICRIRDEQLESGDLAVAKIFFTD